MHQVAIAQTGTLSSVRDAVRNEPSSWSDDDDDDRRRRYHGDSCDDDDWSFCGELTLWAITSPWWGPHAAVDAGLDVPGYFPSHPYHDGYGYMMIDPCVPEAPCTSAMRLSVEYGTNFDELEHFGGRLLWESTSRFGVDADFRLMEEDLTAAFDDSLWLGDVNFVYRFAQSERFVMRSGIGLNWLADNQGADAGFNFTYGGDWFPVDPWVVSSEIDWGTLGSAGIFHARATVGVAVEHTEFYAGYDYYEVDGINLGGFVAGLRVWF